MASTILISDTLNWIEAFTAQYSQSAVTGSSTEPGLTIANKIIQTILAPPFRWRWNRVESAALFNTVAGTTDYVQVLSNFGYLEKTSIFLTGGDPPTRELEVVQNLAKDTKQNPPSQICALLDDGAGNITFRISPAPDAVYAVTLIYQKAATLVTNLSTSGVSNTWTPIPDYFAFLYEQGVLAHIQLMYEPQLAMASLELFFRQLVGAAEGLDSTQRAIFLEDKLREVRQMATMQADIRKGRE